MTYKNRTKARLTRFNNVKLDGLDYNVKTREPTTEDFVRY